MSSNERAALAIAPDVAETGTSATVPVPRMRASLGRRAADTVTAFASHVGGGSCELNGPDGAPHFCCTALLADPAAAR